MSSRAGKAAASGHDAILDIRRGGTRTAWKLARLASVETAAPPERMFSLETLVCSGAMLALRYAARCAKLRVGIMHAVDADIAVPRRREAGIDAARIVASSSI